MVFFFWSNSTFKEDNFPTILNRSTKHTLHTCNRRNNICNNYIFLEHIGLCFRYWILLNLRKDLDYRNFTFVSKVSRVVYCLIVIIRKKKIEMRTSLENLKKKSFSQHFTAENNATFTFPKICLIWFLFKKKKKQFAAIHVLV